MDIFHWVAVVLSTMLGLGIARILSGFAIAFKSRRQVALDWLPLVVAAIVLGEILQFWWALAELAPRASWTLADFTFLVGLAMVLFLAAALIVPTDTPITEPAAAFEQDGRWALLLLAAYHLLAILANAWFWGIALTSPFNAIIGAAALFSAIAALARRRTVQAGAVLCYCAIAVASVLELSPLRY